MPQSRYNSFITWVICWLPQNILSADHYNIEICCHEILETGGILLHCKKLSTSQKPSTEVYTLQAVLLECSHSELFWASLSPSCLIVELSLVCRHHTKEMSIFSALFYEGHNPYLNLHVHVNVWFKLLKFSYSRVENQKKPG